MQQTYKNKMKKIFLLSGILFCMFASCKDKDDDKKIRRDQNPTDTVPVVPAVRRLAYSTFQTVGVDMNTKMRDTINLNLNYEYDSEGRVIKVYDINGYREDYDYKGLVKTTFEGGVETATGELNIGYSIASDSAYNGSYKHVYSYDDNGYIKEYNSKFVVDEKNSSYYSYSYTWQEGNIVSCVVTDGGNHNGAAMELGASDYVYEYTNETVSTPIVNKSDLVFFFDNVMDFSFAYGKKCKNLPVAVNNQKIEWTLDEEGYPVKVVANNAVATFTWK